MSDSEDWDEEDMQAIVIDNGSATIKAGFSGDDKPISIFPSTVGRVNDIDTISSTTTQNIFVGIEAEQQKDTLNIKYPIQHGIVTSWDDMEKIWHHTFYNELKVAPEEHGVLATESPLTPKRNREKTLQIMFETFNVPSMFIDKQCILALHALGKWTGVVLEIGDGMTQLVPIQDGIANIYAATRQDSGGKDLTNYMMKLLSNSKTNDFSFKYPIETSAEREIVKDIKEKTCFVATYSNVHDEKDDFDSDKEIKYELPDGKIIIIHKERYQCPEVLFEGKQDSEAIHKLLYQVIMKCDMTIRRTLFENTVLSGGSTMFPGFDRRLTNEMIGLAPANVKVNIVASPQRNLLVWIGGSIKCLASVYIESWITKNEYDEIGPGIVHRKCF
eukprot:88653_1